MWFYLAVIDSGKSLARCVQDESPGLIAQRPQANHTTNLSKSSLSFSHPEGALLNREHREPGGTEPPHRMAQVSCQLAAHSGYAVPSGEPVFPFGKEREGEWEFSILLPRVTQKKAQICSQLVLRLLSFLWLSRTEQRLGGVCLPPLPHPALPSPHRPCPVYVPKPWRCCLPAVISF